MLPLQKLAEQRKIVSNLESQLKGNRDFKKYYLRSSPRSIYPLLRIPDQKNLSLKLLEFMIEKIKLILKSRIQPQASKTVRIDGIDICVFQNQDSLVTAGLFQDLDRLNQLYSDRKAQLAEKAALRSKEISHTLEAKIPSKNVGKRSHCEDDFMQPTSSYKIRRLGSDLSTAVEKSKERPRTRKVPKRFDCAYSWGSEYDSDSQFVVEESENFDLDQQSDNLIDSTSSERPYFERFSPERHPTPDLNPAANPNQSEVSSEKKNLSTNKRNVSSRSYRFTRAGIRMVRVNEFKIGATRFLEVDHLFYPAKRFSFLNRSKQVRWLTEEKVSQIKSTRPSFVAFQKSYIPDDSVESSSFAQDALGSEWEQTNESESTSFLIDKEELIPSLKKFKARSNEAYQKSLIERSKMNLNNFAFDVNEFRIDSVYSLEFNAVLQNIANKFALEMNSESKRLNENSRKEKEKMVQNPILENLSKRFFPKDKPQPQTARKISLFETLRHSPSVTSSSNSDLVTNARLPVHVNKPQQASNVPATPALSSVRPENSIKVFKLDNEFFSSGPRSLLSNSSILSPSISKSQIKIQSPASKPTNGVTVVANNQRFTNVSSFAISPQYLSKSAPNPGNSNSSVTNSHKVFQLNLPDVPTNQNDNAVEALSSNSDQNVSSIDDNMRGTMAYLASALYFGLHGHVSDQTLEVLSSFMLKKPYSELTRKVQCEISSLENNQQKIMLRYNEQLQIRDKLRSKLQGLL